MTYLAQSSIMASLKQFVEDTTTPPASIGASWGGGFYAGTIKVGGIDYYLVLAPKASGEALNIRWQSLPVYSVSGTHTLNDGYAATQAMVSAGDSTVFPAAHFCRDLRIGGYYDWYMPSRDELELCYRNFKPTTFDNVTTTRFKSAISYPEGDSASTQHGVNLNSVPQGAAYTATVPAQTSLTQFRLPSGSERFDPIHYWSSTEFSNNSAWIQKFAFPSPLTFQTGAQEGNGKDSSENYHVRAVRRVRVDVNSR